MSKDKYEEKDNEKDYDEKNYDSSEDEDEEFPIINLIKYFNTNNIAISGILSYESRVIFIFLHYLNSGLDLLLYIPSKYYIKVDSSVKNYLHISLKVEDEESPHNSIFINSKVTFNRKLYEDMFNRYKPLLEESYYKMCHIDKELLVYINRYNDIESYSFNSPFNKEGFYYMIDLENFYKVSTNIEKELMNIDIMYTSKVYKTIDIELSNMKIDVSEIENEIRTFSSNKKISQYTDRMKKVNDILANNKAGNKSVQDCTMLISKIREDNLKNIFGMEMIIKFLKDYKEIKKK